MAIQQFEVFLHPNQGQPVPKIWGGGFDIEQGKDIVFWGAIDKGLTITHKAARYVGNKSSEKRANGYIRIIEMLDVDSAEAEGILEQVRQALLAAARNETVHIPNSVHQDAIRQAVSAHYGNQVDFNMSMRSVVSVGGLNISDAELNVLVKDAANSSASTGPICNLSW